MVRSSWVIAREIQRHPVRRTVAHIIPGDRPNKPVVAELPLHLVGDAVEVRHADWKVDQQMSSLEIKARPDQIPTTSTSRQSTSPSARRSGSRTWCCPRASPR